SFDVAAINQPTTWGLDNWTRAFTEPRTVQALWNSLALGLGRTLVSLPIAIGMAWLISRTDMPHRSLIEAIVWLGVFTPTLPLVEGWILLLDPHFGLINTAWQSLPFASGPLFDLYS